MNEVLAQQSQFSQFALNYCCLLPAGSAAVLGIVYFAIRHFAEKSDRGD